MRCKNCGCENDEKLYICENCGSPLYDEDEQEAIGGTTKTFSTDEINKATAKPAPKKPSEDEDEEEKKKQQRNIIIIVVLAVVLVSIIIGIIIAVASGNKKVEDATSETSTTEITTEATTEANNQIETTEDETTTETTTEKPTEPSMCTVNLTCNNGGEVEGDGRYELGENVTIIARPDDGYEFGGWYDGSTKISSNTKFKFTLTNNVNYKAVFIIVQMEDAPADTDEPIDNTNGVDD